MRATQEHEIRLFDGECVAHGCRGRRSDLPINKNTSRWIAVIVGGLMLGFAGAATAIHRYPAPQQQVNTITTKNFNLTFATFDDVLW